MEDDLNIFSPSTKLQAQPSYIRASPWSSNVFVFSFVLCALLFD
jgi:hypothetical protein